MLLTSLSPVPQCVQRKAPLVNGQLSAMSSGGPHPLALGAERVLLEEQPYIQSRFVELESSAGDGGWEGGGKGGEG